MSGKDDLGELATAGVREVFTERRFSIGLLLCCSWSGYKGGWNGEPRQAQGIGSGIAAERLASVARR